MRDLVLSLVLAVLSTTATDAGAQHAAPTTQKVVQAGDSPGETADPNKVICIHEEQQTGSRIAPHMLCGTREEWAERLQEDRTKTDHIQMGSLQH